MAALFARMSAPNGLRSRSSDILYRYQSVVTLPYFGFDLLSRITPAEIFRWSLGSENVLRTYLLKIRGPHDSDYSTSFDNIKLLADIGDDGQV